ncbi:hypothetical protein TNCV_750781 [Trichonephila clavipes]|nr:hypothetical protein TNCV_750781 [Trichonephila clavipes]
MFASSELRCFPLGRKLDVKITYGDWYPPIWHHTKKEIPAFGECSRPPRRVIKPPYGVGRAPQFKKHCIKFILQSTLDNSNFRLYEPLANSKYMLGPQKKNS